MFEKLKQLSILNEKAENLIEEVNKCNMEMTAEYNEKETVALEDFMSAMKELAKYSGLIIRNNFGDRGIYHANTGISLSFYKSSAGSPSLFFSTNKHGDFKFFTQTYVYGGDFTIYSSEDEVWRWHDNDCKNFFATHAKEILTSVQNIIEKSLEENILDRLELVQQKQLQILTDISILSAESDKGLDEKLKDAIQKTGSSRDMSNQKNSLTR